ncbi:MAG TPA: carbamoyltransferase HypF [Steroidobacteraceae bacterium]|nr:carbamoyltransferase HypF [Steroidobacteraceae bacterium]
MTSTPAADTATTDLGPIARRVRVTGRVQGVGFRPFVYRLATGLGLTGEVCNRTGEVDIHVEGAPAAIRAFVEGLISKAPPLSAPVIDRVESVAPIAASGFRIAPSAGSEAPRIFVPPDYFACEDCLREMQDPGDRRYRYPFINCTQCGPRYTLITALPYDRPATTMAGFELCPQCRQEYEDPRNRRFHAEPVACPVCGPQVRLVDGAAVQLAGPSAIDRTIDLLRQGTTVAVKGIGGYHLLCDARSEAAVQRLRDRKRRPGKPLAVMFPLDGADGLDAVRRELQPGARESELLLSPARPIVLATRRRDSQLAPGVAPGLAEVGAFLPYSPLHALLLEGFGGPLVATSGNVSGEPVLTSEDDASSRLAAVADAFLHHDRPIARPADDSVCRVIAGQGRPIRVGRGLAPLELRLDQHVDRPMLAVGGHLKTTVALAWQDRVVVSPHIGDMGTPRSQEVFEQVVRDLPRLYGVVPEMLVCDSHPGYATTRWARRAGLPCVDVQHHCAHASALAGEHGRTDGLIAFAWDGVGLGADGMLWGGECFVGGPGSWRRVARLRPFRLPGGDRAGREPWRSAASMCWHAGLEWLQNPAESLVRVAWEQGLNSPYTSAVGRLFDAAAAIVLGVHAASFEGEGPMRLEAAAESASTSGIELPLTRTPDHDLLDIDWQPLLAALLVTDRPVAERADLVHSTLAYTMLALARRIRSQTGVSAAGLTGGVFQNRRLCEYAHAALVEDGFEVLLPVQIPCNDGGLAYGQILEVIGRQVSDR